MPMTSPTGKPSPVFLASAFAFLALPPPPPLTAQEGHHAHTGIYDGPTVLRAARLLDVQTGEIHTDAVSSSSRAESSRP